MPTPLEFMERVIPWPGPSGPGWGNIHYKRTATDGKPRWYGEPFKTADDFIERAQKLATSAAKAEDIYFCTSVQAMTKTITHKGRTFPVAERSAEHALAMKAIWLDVDVKAPPKGYATLKDALAAIRKFVDDAHIPEPDALIMSGGGVHVYWISDKPLTIMEWLPYAEGLKFEAQRHGLLADYGCTADAARILRVPGTYNRKDKAHPRAVKVLALSAADTNFATALAGLHATGLPKVTAPVTKAAPFDLSAFAGGPNPLLAALNASTDKLSDGIERRSDLPLDPSLVFKECPHYRDAIKTGGKGHGQGLWNLTVLGTTWFVNGRDFARAVSKGYPSYTPEETDALFDRKMDERAKGLGWPSCKAFQNEGSKHCAGCVFRPQDRSPLNLAERIKEDPAPSVPAVTNPITQATLTATDLKLPREYGLNSHGVVSFLDVDDDGETHPLPLFHGQVTAEPWCSNTIPPTLYFLYRQGDNHSKVTVPYNKLASDSTLQDCLTTQAVMTVVENEKYVRRFMKSWVAKIEDAHRRQTSAPFGWVIENGVRRGFAYGGRLFKADGTEEDAGYPDKELRECYSPQGEINPIMKLFDVITEQGRGDWQALCLQSFVSPLLYVMGLKFLNMWSWSNLGGSGKSTAIMTGMALWSAPGKSKSVAGTTQVGLEVKMNQLQNLPVIVDEITDDETLDQLFTTIQLASEGQGRDRGTRAITAAKKSNWKCAMVCGSNTSMHEFQKKRHSVSNAGPRRVFEFQVPPNAGGSYSMIDVERLVDSLDYNYGQIGLVYAKYLAMNFDKLKARTDEIIAEIDPLVAPLAHEENFWRGQVVLTLLAAEIANEILDKPYFHRDALKTFMMEKFKENRQWAVDNLEIGGTSSEAEVMLSRFFDDHINNQLVTDKMNTGAGAPVKLTVLERPPENSGKGNAVQIRWSMDPALVQISVPELEEWLRRIDKPTSIIKTIAKHYRGVLRSKINMMAGVELKQVKLRVKVLEIAIDEQHPLYTEWCGKRDPNAKPAATLMSAAAQQQDVVTAAVTAGIAQAQADLATVRGAT